MFLTALAIPVMAQVGFSPSALTDTPYPLMLSALFILLGLYGLNWHGRHERVITIPQKEEPPASPWANELLAIRTIVWNENPLLAVSVDRDDKMSFYSMPKGHGVEVDDTPFRRRCSC